MADDIGTRGQDPRDVALARREQGMIRRAQQRALEEAGRRVAVTSAGGSGAGGGGGGSRALTPSGGDRLPAPRGGSSNLPAVQDNRIPLNLGPVSRGASQLGLRAAGAAGMALDPTSAATATLTGTPEGRRMLAEDAARRTMTDPNYSETANEAAAALRAANERRQATRPTTRMRPSGSRGNEMSADELNAISLARGEGYDGPAAANIRRRLAEMEPGMKKGGPVKKMAKGGPVKASKKGMKPVYKMAKGGAARGDGCAARGKTKGRMI